MRGGAPAVETRDAHERACCSAAATNASKAALCCHASAMHTRAATAAMPYLNDQQISIASNVRN